QAHFLGTNLDEFKESIVHLATRGNIRKTLDNMMKLDVFESVATVEAEQENLPPEPIYLLELLPQYSLESLMPKPAREFISRVFDDVLTAVENDANYDRKYSFDKHVFQKFIAV